MRQHRAAQVEDRIEIDGERGVPVVLGQVEQRAAAVDAGVVHQDVDPAVRRGDIVDQLGARLSAGDVDRACLGAQAAIPQASGDGFCEPFVDVTDDDVCAFGREALTDRRTDTTTAPGDDRNGVPESFHYFSSFSSLGDCADEPSPARRGFAGAGGSADACRVVWLLHRSHRSPYCQTIRLYVQGFRRFLHRMCTVDRRIDAKQQVVQQSSSR